ncbi:MAG: ribosome biogenesis GTP-binding protein YihA/YsxC [Deltaproteobacteria bacterium]|jgi:GTP-binding protein|nr:ribosome biogenesis GTP-binding protein YihA/YsxC [Deltaproteobacteria bacterium]
MAKIISPPAVEAVFLQSAAKAGQFPSPIGLEVALLGRSNCGKSSLLNRWLGRRALARVGAAPGRTRLVNFFRVVWNNGVPPMMVVDLPGYGFAAAPKAMVDSWRGMVADYLESGRGPQLALLLMDIRRGVQKEEKDLVRWLKNLGLPYQIIATKADKVSTGKCRQAVAELRKSLGGAAEPLAFSSLSGQGREELIALVLERQKECSSVSESPSGNSAPAADFSAEDS